MLIIWSIKKIGTARYIGFLLAVAVCIQVHWQPCEKIFNMIIHDVNSS